VWVIALLGTVSGGVDELKCRCGLCSVGCGL